MNFLRSNPIPNIKGTIRDKLKAFMRLAAVEAPRADSTLGRAVLQLLLV